MVSFQKPKTTLERPQSYSDATSDDRSSQRSPGAASNEKLFKKINKIQDIDDRKAIRQKNVEFSDRLEKASKEQTGSLLRRIESLVDENFDQNTQWIAQNLEQQGHSIRKKLETRKLNSLMRSRSSSLVDLSFCSQQGPSSVLGALLAGDAQQPGDEQGAD